MPSKTKARKKHTPRKTVAEMRAEARARALTADIEIKTKPDRAPNGQFLPGNTAGNGHVGQKPRAAYEHFDEGSPEFKRAVTGLAKVYMSQTNAALVLGLSPEAFKKRLIREPGLRAIWDEGRAHAEFDLRMKQSKLAATAPGMAIFLGKNYLGQRDEQHIVKNETKTLKLDIGKLSPDKLRTLQGIMKELNPAPEAVDAEFEAVA